MVRKRVFTFVHTRREEAFLAEVARAYYERDLTQEQLARQLGVTRSQVSRYLSAARARGIVQIRVVAPESRDTDSEAALRARFPQLREVIVAPAFLPEGPVVQATVARAGARLVERLVAPGWTVCFGAGRTLAELVGQLRPKRHGEIVGEIVVVQAMGNAGHEGLHIDYNAVAQAVAAAFGGRAFQVNAPAILGRGLSAAELEAANPSIRHALELARAADLHVLGVGSLGGDEIYVKTGLVTLDELDDLRAAGAVGDICGNFFDVRGRACPSPFQDRLVGIRLDDLRRAQLAVACATGQDKVPAIVGALAGRLVSALVTDEHTAAGVLELARGRRASPGGRAPKGGN